MSVQQTKATLTVKVITRDDPHFWQSRVKKVAIVLSMRNIVPNLTDTKVVMEWTKGGWAITKDLHQWNQQNSGSWDKVYSEIKHTDNELRDIFLTILGNTHFRGVKLTPERAIARLIGGIEPWKKATWESLNILK